MIQIFKDTNYDFLGKRRFAAYLSLTAIGIGIIFLFFHHGLKMGVDFVGGTLIQVHFERPVTIGDVRISLTTIGHGTGEIKDFGDGQEILIRVETGVEDVDIPMRILGQLRQDFSGNAVEMRRVEQVGPKIGGELITGAVRAVLFSLVVMLIYISIRFEFKFAVGAIVALTHDVLVTLGIFSILGLEMTLPAVAAILTIVGYSLNDTIVIFDRVRENLKLMRRDILEVIINKSINGTLSRTIITSGTTFIVVLILFLFGGEVIHDFAFTLIVGVITGTYSTVYIASPVVIYLDNRMRAKKQPALQHRKQTSVG